MFKCANGGHVTEPKQRMVIVPVEFRSVTYKTESGWTAGTGLEIVREKGFCELCYRLIYGGAL